MLGKYKCSSLKTPPSELLSINSRLMDHIALPKDRDPFDLKVPFIACHYTGHDGLDFQTVTDPSKCTFADLQQKPPAEAAAFVQAWLYFGLLQEVFGPLYRQGDFVRYDGEEAFVTTKMLLSLINTKVATSLEYLWWLRFLLKVPRMRKWVEQYFHHVRDVKKERARISRILKRAAQQCDNFDFYLETPEWPVILLTIRILIQSLHILCRQKPADLIHRYHFDHWYSAQFRFPPDAESSQPVRSHMLRNGSGWCKHQYVGLMRKVSVVTMVYLANLKRHEPPWTNHANCQSEGRCIAYNSDDSSEPVHVRDDCKCSHVHAPLSKMHEILGDGGVPVVKCSRDRYGKFILTYLRASPGASYAAVSHLWSGGLGSRRGNSIPLCQLEKLFNAIARSDCAVARYSQPPGSNGLSYRLAKYGMDRKNLIAKLSYRPQREPRSVFFWLDIYCVPVVDRTVQSYTTIGENSEVGTLAHTCTGQHG